MQSNFNFISIDWPQIYKSASKSEESSLKDPRTACFYSRRSTELIVEWIYEHDNTLRRPYESSLSNLIHGFDFRELVGEQLLGKFKLLKDLGNKAVHRNDPISQGNAVLAEVHCTTFLPCLHLSLLLCACVILLYTLYTPW